MPLILVKPPPIDASVPAKPVEAPSPVRMTLGAVRYADQSKVLAPAPPSIAPVTLAPSANEKVVLPPPPVRLTGWVPAIRKVSEPPPKRCVNPVNLRILIGG